MRRRKEVLRKKSVNGYSKESIQMKYADAQKVRILQRLDEGR